jgi:hypothetical protein
MVGPGETEHARHRALSARTVSLVRRDVNGPSTRRHGVEMPPIYQDVDNILTYNQHPVTYAMSEGLNSQIQKIKNMACGFRKVENFKTAIYFHCGGLDLYPY